MPFSRFANQKFYRVAWTDARTDEARCVELHTLKNARTVVTGLQHPHYRGRYRDIVLSRLDGRRGGGLVIAFRP